MRLRRTRPAAVLLPVLLPVLLLAPVLAACSDDADGTSDGTADDTPSSTAPVPSETPTTASSPATPSDTVGTSSAPAASLPAACTLITADDVAKVMGVSFAAGEADREDEQEGGFAWNADECSFEATDLVEVSVQVAGLSDFTGDFGCPMPSDADGTVEPADVAGAAQAWWKVSPPPNFEGVVRACSPNAVVDVHLDYEDGVDYQGDPSEQAPRLAEFVLANLQG